MSLNEIQYPILSYILFDDCSRFLYSEVVSLIVQNIPSIVTLSFTHSLSPSLPYSLLHSLTLSFSHSLSPLLTHSLLHSLTHSFSHSLSPSLTHSLLHSLTLSFTHSLSPSVTHSLLQSLTLSFTRSLTTSLLHSLTLSFTRSLTTSLVHSLSLTLLYPIFFFASLFFLPLTNSFPKSYSHCNYISFYFRSYPSDKASRDSSAL